MSELHNIMQNIEVDRGDSWLCMNRYVATKEDLIAARLAKEFMFAEPPKRNKCGHMDRNGWPIDGHPFDYGDKYDSCGKTRAIYWSNRRVKGGKYELIIEKSWEEIQALKNPLLTEDSYLEWAHILLAHNLANGVMAAQGEHVNNPKGYHLSKHYEITQLIDRVAEVVKTSTVIATHDDKPFRVIDGGQS